MQLVYDFLTSFTYTYVLLALGLWIPYWGPYVQEVCEEWTEPILFVLTRVAFLFTGWTWYTTFKEWLARRDTSKYVDEMLAPPDVAPPLVEKTFAIETKVGKTRRRRRYRDPFVRSIVYELKTIYGTPKRSPAMDRLLREKINLILDRKDGFRDHQRFSIICQALALIYIKSDDELDMEEVMSCGASKERGKGQGF